MWRDAPLDPAARRVYFSANWLPLHPGGPLPTHALVAYFGVWLDCNGDGYVGSAAIAAETYPSRLLTDARRCPLSSPHHVEGVVTEFLWIGPGSNGLADDAARVWMDWGRPGEASVLPKSSVEEELSFSPHARGPRWHGATHQIVPHETRLGGTWTTAYGSTDLGASHRLSFPPGSSVYGAEGCADRYSNWACDRAWTSRIQPGAPYQVRDVDCHDAPGVASERGFGMRFPEPCGEEPREVTTARSVPPAVFHRVRDAYESLEEGLPILLPETCDALCTRSTDLGIPGPLVLNVYWNGTAGVLEWVYQGSFDCSMWVESPTFYGIDWEATCVPTDVVPYHCVNPGLTLVHTGGPDDASQAELSCGTTFGDCFVAGSAGTCTEFLGGDQSATLYCRAFFDLIVGGGTGVSNPQSQHVTCVSDPPEFPEPARGVA